MVTKWVSWYKAHRATLIHPIVHIRRADMQSWDGWLHVNPFAYGAGNVTSQLSEVGVAMLFNPTASTISVTIAVPVYYTGLSISALVSVDDGEAKVMAVERDYSVRLQLEMAPGSIHTAVLARPPHQ